MFDNPKDIFMSQQDNQNNQATEQDNQTAIQNEQNTDKQPPKVDEANSCCGGCGGGGH